MSRFVRAGGDTTVADPARPLITYYDDATGERTELSGATLDNWVSKTANLLVDGHGLGPGDIAAVFLPPHWQTAAVLLGCWSVGLVVVDAGRADIAFAAADRLDEARGAGRAGTTGRTGEAGRTGRTGEAGRTGGAGGAGDVYGLALAPLAAPMRPGPPPGVLDYAVEVRAYGDHFLGGPVGHELTSRAVRRARELGIASGARVLIDVDSVTGPIDWLLAPLAAGASIVLCRHLDRARLADRLAAERATLLTVT